MAMRKKTKLLLQENNRTEQALSETGRALLTDIVVYLRGSRISTWEQEQVRRDITQMLYDAEARGEQAEAVIGPDPKAFCDSILAELPPMPRWESLLCTLRDGLLATAILAAIWLGFGVLEGLLGAGSWPELTLTIGQLISGGGILLTACGVVYWICRRSFSVEQKKGTWILLFLVVFGVLCAGIFLRQPIATLPVPAAAGGVVGLFAVYKVMDLRLD
jgi:DNA-binding ferritin-like protein (Dps family)